MPTKVAMWGRMIFRPYIATVGEFLAKGCLSFVGLKIPIRRLRMIQPPTE
ncbi:MAG: hypothetical protein LBU34_05940 [Planctomycetaceae bacterium]|nr:hypothetical protein [Planctomycetaceae bacterium]